MTWRYSRFHACGVAGVGRSGEGMKMGNILSAMSGLENPPLETKMYYVHESHLIKIYFLYELIIVQCLRRFIILV